MIYRKAVIFQHRSERKRADRKNMIQECKNFIVEDDFYDFCIGTVKVLNSYER